LRVKCQKDYRQQHKKAFEKRAAELRDDILFKQPEGTHLGDCPICCLPLPIDPKKNVMTACCSKVICHGCDYADTLRELGGRIDPKCPFCRRPPPKSEAEADLMNTKRVDANDPFAHCVKWVRRVTMKGSTKVHSNSDDGSWVGLY
jgi:hypothetical protein